MRHAPSRSTSPLDSANVTAPRLYTHAGARKQPLRIEPIVRQAYAGWQLPNTGSASPPGGRYPPHQHQHSHPRRNEQPLAPTHEQHHERRRCHDRQHRQPEPFAVDHSTTIDRHSTCTLICNDREKHFLATFGHGESGCRTLHSESSATTLLLRFRSSKATNGTRGALPTRGRRPRTETSSHVTKIGSIHEVQTLNRRPAARFAQLDTGLRATAPRIVACILEVSGSCSCGRQSWMGTSPGSTISQSPASARICGVVREWTWLMVRWV